MADSIEKRISVLARRQHGYVKRSQLLALGMTRHGIAHRLKTGRLIAVHRGVHAVGHLPQHPLDRAHGALLACGRAAVLSHGSAATVYGIHRSWEPAFEVTVPTLRRHTGIRAHRAKLTRDDVSVQLGIRVTSPARTLLDMAPRLTDRQLRRAFNKLRLSHHLRPEHVRDMIERFPRHPGAARLTPLAATRRGATHSGIEDKFADFCEHHGLPEPAFNGQIAGRQVDALFPAHRLIVEIDAYETHSGPVSFADDRDRDATMLALGLATVRVTEERMDSESECEAARLRTILAGRRAA